MKEAIEWYTMAIKDAEPDQAMVLDQQDGVEWSVKDTWCDEPHMKHIKFLLEEYKQEYWSGAGRQRNELKEVRPR